MYNSTMFPEHLILHQIPLGPLQNFLYFVGDDRTKEIAVVDPAWDVKALVRMIEKHAYKVTCVYLTHGHPDHVNGLDAFLKEYDVPAYLSKHEHPLFIPKHKNLIKVEKGFSLTVGKITFTTILAPGHSSGCQLLLYKNVCIAGDVIFIDGCGRCDLPGGDAAQMYDTLYDIVMKLPDDTILYPGHDYGPAPFATVASQKKTNPYLTCKSKDEFLYQRIG